MTQDAEKAEQIQSGHLLSPSSAINLLGDPLEVSTMLISPSTLKR